MDYSILPIITVNTFQDLKIDILIEIQEYKTDFHHITTRLTLIFEVFIHN